MPVAEGDKVELDRVLMVSDGDKVAIGNPVVAGAKVLATSLGTNKGEKVIIFRYKSKVRSRRKKGHRQLLTKLAIDRITTSGGEAKEEISSHGA